MFKRILGTLTLASLIISIIACSDNSTNPKNEEGMSSEQNASSSEVSSSSKTNISSSSVKFSSSSVNVSSSSNTVVSSSSSDPSSNLFKDDFFTNGFSKEDIFNPEIDYDTIIDGRDGQVYKIVTIGSQIWMAENLNYADSVKTPSLLGKSWCYHDLIENCAVAGRLYTWAAAIDSVSLAEDSENPITCGTSVECTLPETVQGICPEGWHLPSSEEWTTLETFVGGNTEAGTYLKSKAGWKEYVDVSNLDSFGFSAFPAGQIHLTLSLNFSNGLYTTSWWTATENSSIYANHRYMTFSKNYIGSVNLSKIVGYSVRCVKD